MVCNEEATVRYRSRRCSMLAVDSDVVCKMNFANDTKVQEEEGME